MNREPTPSIDYTSRDYEGFRKAMIDELGVRMPEYTDTSETDAGIVIIENNAKCLDILSFYADIMANETLLTTCKRRNNANKWCSILSYVPRNSTPSRVMQVFVLVATQSVPVTIPAGTRVKTKGSTSEPEIIFETEEDLTIPIGKLGNEKDSHGKYLYQVSAVQGVSVEGELVGSSNGTANQKFQLNYSPVIADSVEVIVNEGSGFAPWTRVDNFVDSDATSRDYTLSLNDNDIVTIQFGDGVFGKIPTSYTNGIFANYRVGGGSSGNVGANTVVVMDTNLALVDSTFNPEGVYERGVDKETVDELKVNAPRYSDTKWGALTLKDFADVVLLNFPDVVLANSERDSEDIDSIHIYLLTKDGATISDSLMSEITAFFDENEGGRKIVGANKIFIEPASLVPKDFTISLVVKDRYSRASVKGLIEELMQDYFALGNYDFGQYLSTTELAAYIMNPDNGINGIKSLYFVNPDTTVITPEASQIFTLGELTIDAAGGVE